MKNREYYAVELANAIAEGKACNFKKERVHNALDCGGIKCAECVKKTKEWLDQEANVKPRITRAEYDILDALCDVAKIYDDMDEVAVDKVLDATIDILQDKGYFEDLEQGQKVTSFLATCEVIEDD